MLRSRMPSLPILFVWTCLLLLGSLFQSRSLSAQVKCLTNPDVALSAAQKTKLQRIQNSNSYNSPSGRFVIYYEITGNDAVPLDDSMNNNGIPDYVEKTALYADESWEKTIGYGFPDPLTGSDDPYPIFLEYIGNAYGYMQGTTANPHGTFMAINSDFEGFNDDLTIEELLQVTIAHEFKHVVQHGQTRLSSRYESTFWREFDAVLMEDVVYDDANDYYLFIGTSLSIFNEPEEPVRPGTLSELGKGYYKMTFNHYFYERFGIQFWVDVWNRIEQNNDLRMIEAMQPELQLRGTSWEEEFTRMFAWHMVTDGDLSFGYGFEEQAFYPSPELTPWSTTQATAITQPVNRTAQSLAPTAADLLQIDTPLPSDAYHVLVYPEEPTQMGSASLSFNAAGVQEHLHHTENGAHLYNLSEMGLQKAEISVVNTSATASSSYDLHVIPSGSYQHFTWGDLTQDSTLSDADIVTGLAFLVDPARSLSAKAYEAGDISGEGGLTPYDFALLFDQLQAQTPIFARVDDNNDGFGPDAGFFNRAAVPVAKQNGPIHTLKPQIIQNAGTLELPLERATGEPVRSVYLELQMDSDTFTFVDFDAAGIGMPDGSQYDVYYDQNTGILRLAAIFSEPATISYLGAISYEGNADFTLIRGFFDERENGFKQDDTQLLNTPEESSSMPDAFVLDQNYPNPFNPQTTIAFEIPRAARVQINVFNSVGQRVAEVVDQNFSAGAHQVLFNAQGLASGVYTYIMVADGNQLLRRMTVLK